MPTKITIAKVTVRYEETELPDECPQCGADLTVADQPLIERSHAPTSAPAHIEGTLIESDGDTEIAYESAAVIGYDCALCGAEIVERKVETDRA